MDDRHKELEQFIENATNQEIEEYLYIMSENYASSIFASFLKKEIAT